MNEHFSPIRLGRLIWTDLLVRLRPVAMISAIFAVLMLLHGLVSAQESGPQTNVFPFWVMLMLFAWGPIAASLSFRELHDRTKNTAYLLLPASALEKTLSRLLLVTVLFVVHVIVLTNVVSWANAGINRILFGYEGLLFPIFGQQGWLELGFFLVNQSFYFLGAAWFRKTHFVKTALVLTFGSIAMLFVTGTILQLVFGDGMNGAFDPNPNIDFEAFFAANRAQLLGLGRTAMAIFFFVIPVFCWAVAWLRVKETQVSYGV